MTPERAETAPVPPPATSPDGRFWWDGQKWVPFDQVPTTAVAGSTIATSVAGGIGKFVLGLVLIPLVLLLLVVIMAAISLGSFGYAVVPLVLAGGLALWYFKRLR